MSFSETYCSIPVFVVAVIFTVWLATNKAEEPFDINKGPDVMYHHALAHYYGQLLPGVRSIGKSTAITILESPKLNKYEQAVYFKSLLYNSTSDHGKRVDQLKLAMELGSIEAIEDVSIILSTMRVPLKQIINDYKKCADYGFIYSKTVMCLITLKQYCDGKTCLVGDKKYCEGPLHPDTFKIHDFADSHSELMSMLTEKMVDRSTLVRNGIFRDFGYYIVSKEVHYKIPEYKPEGKKEKKDEKPNETEKKPEETKPPQKQEKPKKKIKKEKPPVDPQPIQPETLSESETKPPKQEETNPSQDCNRIAKLGGTPQTFPTYSTLLKQCADDHNHSDSQFITGIGLSSIDKNESLKYLNKACENNHRGALDLMINYLKSENVESKDLIKLIARRNKLKMQK